MLFISIDFSNTNSDRFMDGKSADLMKCDLRRKNFELFDGDALEQKLRQQLRQSVLLVTEIDPTLLNNRDVNLKGENNHHVNQHNQTLKSL